MKLYDVGEAALEGFWYTPTIVDGRPQATIKLGRDIQDHEATVYLPISKADSEYLLQHRRDAGLLKEGRLLFEDGEYYLSREAVNDSLALVRLGVSPGIGGKISIDLGGEIKVLKTAAIGSDMNGDRLGIRLLLMWPHATIFIKRTGELDGAPPAMLFTWDGIKLHQDLV